MLAGVNKLRYKDLRAQGPTDLTLTVRSSQRPTEVGLILLISSFK